MLVTCAGEELDVVVNTIEAACASNYPVDRFRVVVLDDAASDELASSIKSLSDKNENLYYTARTKGEDHDFKAGNLNHGYGYVKSLPGGPGEYIAGLDADMIPEPDWLRALLPHLLQNPKAALAQLPQVNFLLRGRFP